MEQLFITLSRAIEGSIGIALGASFLWGILSVVLSPCHLASIPLIIGFISDQGQLTARQAFRMSLLFGTGILVTIALIGVLTAAMGRMYGDVGIYGNFFVALIFLVVGLHLIGIIPMPFSGPGNVGMKRRGLLASFLMGLIFGIALGPCSFAYMAPMLAVTFKTGATNLFFGIALLAAYGIGHCAVIVAAGTSAEAVQRYLDWNEKSKGARIIKSICGALVILGGIYLVVRQF